MSQDKKIGICAIDLEKEYLQQIANNAKEQMNRSTKLIEDYIQSHNNRIKKLMEDFDPIKRLHKQLESAKKTLSIKTPLEELAKTYTQQQFKTTFYPLEQQLKSTFKKYQETFLQPKEDALKSILQNLPLYQEYITQPTTSSVAISKKKVILTDDGLTLAQKLSALDITAQKFLSYIDKNIEDDNLKEVAISKALNLQMIKHTSNPNKQAQQLKSAKTFFEHLTNAKANTIKEDKDGFYYDLILEALIRYINAYATLQEHLKTYKEVCKLRLDTACRKRSDYDYITNLVKILAPFVPKANQAPIKLDMSIVYLLAQSLQCDYPSFAKAFYYILYNQKAHPLNIYKVKELNPSSLLQIISF